MAETAAVGLRLGVAVLVLLIALVGGRIVPSFTSNWLKKRGETGLPQPFGRFDRATLGITVAALLAWVIAPGARLAAVALFAAGLANLVRLARWRGHRTLAEPLVWVLHVGYAWLAAGLILSGLGVQWPPAALPGTAGLHALTAGAIGTMTLAVMTRAALGHTGRSLSAGPGTALIYTCVSLGALFRVAASFSTEPLVLSLAGALWGGAFVLFTALYGPLLMRPRAGERQPPPAARRNPGTGKVPDSAPGPYSSRRWRQAVEAALDVPARGRWSRSGRCRVTARTEPGQGRSEALPTRREELLMFALLAVLIWPVIAVAVVGGYGFLVWMWQLVFGPPGPPGL